MEQLKERLITTAISYPNGVPHIGHMYEAILADIYNRLSILNGVNSKLLTGTDEHGKKIQVTAQNKGMTPIELCNMNSDLFKRMLENIDINYDLFIRTTDNDHIQLVTKVVELTSNDIFKSTYSGYYNIREETFVSPTDARENEYKDPVTGDLLEIREEETYMFCLSKFEEYIRENLHRVYNFNTDSFDERLSKLQDLSITRLKSEEFNWGIDFPLDHNHVIYVWYDALLNYITGLVSLFNSEKVETIHVIGKDIVWFHCVIYPAILKSMGVFHIYDKIFVHGFILDANGNKMSKSLNNVVDPQYLLDKYQSDYIRFYLFMETNPGSDIKFSEERLVSVCNSILVNGFGNLFQRLYKLWLDVDYYPFSSFTHENNDSIDILNDFVSLRTKLIDDIDSINREITENKPWAMSLHNKKNFLIGIGSKFYSILCILSCIIPEKIKYLNSYLGFTIPGIHYDIPPSYIYIAKLKAFDKLKL